MENVICKRCGHTTKPELANKAGLCPGCDSEVRQLATEKPKPAPKPKPNKTEDRFSAGAPVREKKR